MRRFREIQGKTSHHLAKRLLLFWTVLLALFGFLRWTFAAIPGIHGGRVIVEKGRQYEVVANPGLHQIKVYAAPIVGPPSSTLTVYLRSRGRPRNPVKLVLSGISRDSWIYSGLIPAGILISGGVRVEVELK
jgi:hypothetical protein